MIVASWVMSTIISLPPLFGLKDPSDYSPDAVQTTNASLGDSYDPPATSQDGELAQYDYDLAWDYDGGLNYHGKTYAEPYPMYFDEFVNETISSDLEEMHLICIISQNLGYTVFLTVGARDFLEGS